MKKKITTLFLALALCVSVGTAAAISSSKTAAQANAEAQNGVAEELTVSATEMYTFTDADPSAHTPEAAAPAVAAWQTVLGMKKFVNTMTTADVSAYIGFDEVDVSDYAYVNFKAMFWAEGGVGSYADTDIYTAENEDSGYNAQIFYAWASSESYTESSLYVSIPTAAIKNAEGKVGGIVIKNSVTDKTSGWFMIGDLTFSNYRYTRVDTANSNSVSGEATYGVTLQNGDPNDTSKPTQEYVKNWKTEELVYRTSIAARAAFVTTVRFIAPVPATDVDYFCMKILGWEYKAPYAAVTLKNLDGTTVTTLDVYYDWTTVGDLYCYFPADGLKDESGMINGYILDCPGATNLLFTDAIGYKGAVEPIIDIAKSRSGEGALNKREWAGIPPVAAEGLYYNGDTIENGTISVAFETPIDSSVYKTVDFKMLIWNKAAIKDVEIRKLDGTLVETIKATASYANENGDIGVKINATLLADENGKVSGFKMNVLDNAQGHVVFSELSGNTEEKTYSATITFADGTKHTFEYTATNRAEKLAEIKEALGNNGAQYTFSNDLPEELPFAEGRTYTETSTVNNYDVKIGDADAVKVAYGEKLVKPADDPVKEPTVSTVYTFDGWYNGEEKWDFDNDTVTGNVTLVAKFNESPRTYDVKFGNADAIKVAYGEKLVKPADPTESKEGYTSTFDGWYNGEEKWDFDNDTVTGDVTLVAGFTNVAIEYVAKIVLADGTEKEVKYTIESRAAKLEEIKALLGADNDEFAYENDLPAELPLESKTYTETRTVKKYDVKFGEADAVKVAYGDKLVKPADPVKEPTVSTVYTFDGWYNGNVKWNFDTDTVKGDVTLVAKFGETARKYTVTVTFEGLEKASVTIEAAYNEKIDLDKYNENGYTAVIKNGDTEITELVVTGDVTITVEYKAAASTTSGCGGAVGGAGMFAFLAAIGAAVIALRKKQD